MATVARNGFSSPSFPTGISWAAALSFANLAPSSHNSQPWGIASVESPVAKRALAQWLGPIHCNSNDSWTVLALDRNRTLAALPAHAVEMRLSSGMFLHLTLASLADQGWSARVVPLCKEGVTQAPIPGWPAHWVPVAAVAAKLGPPRSPAWSLATAPSRRTNRGPYTTERVDRAPLLRLKQSEALFDDVDGSCPAHVHLLDDPALIGELGTFVSRNAHVDLTHDDAWRETYRYIQFSDAEVASALDGFPISQLVGPMSAPMRRLLQTIFSPGAMRILRHARLPHFMAHQLGALVGASPLLTCITVARRTPWVEVVAGGLAMDLWMRATEAGLALHPVSVVLQHDALRKRFQERAKLSNDVVFFARLGRPISDFPPTPRRTITPNGAGWLQL